MLKRQFVYLLILLATCIAKAQVVVHVNVGTPPVCAPAERIEVQYYYLPDIDAYYDVPLARFIYIKNGNWFRSASLPYRYRNYNLKRGAVIYLTDYTGNEPYLFHKNHKIKYVKKMKYHESDFDNKNINHEYNHDNGSGKEHKKGKKIK